MAVRRLARQARRENNNMRLEAVAIFDRVHLKRELKAEDLNAFIETMEERLYKGEIELTEDGKKPDVIFLREAFKTLKASTQNHNIPLFAKMNVMERSYHKLESVSDQLIHLIEKLERRSQIIQVSRLSQKQGKWKEDDFVVQNMLRKQDQEKYLEELSHLPSARRAELKCQYGTTAWNSFLKGLKGKGISSILPMIPETTNESTDDAVRYKVMTTAAATVTTEDCDKKMPA